MRLIFSHALQHILGLVLENDTLPTLTGFSKLLAECSDILPFDAKIPEAQGVVGEKIRAHAATSNVNEFVEAMRPIKTADDVNATSFENLTVAFSNLSGVALEPQHRKLLVEVVTALLHASAQCTFSQADVSAMRGMMESIPECEQPLYLGLSFVLHCHDLQ